MSSTLQLARLPRPAPAPDSAVQAERPVAQQIQIRGHALLGDVPADKGGADLGPSPHELDDAALGACKALTVLMYARRRGMPVDDVQTTIVRDDSAERQGTYRLSATLQISGDLSDEQLHELETVAGKCPVHKLMTAVTTEIATQVVRAAGAPLAEVQP